MKFEKSLCSFVFTLILASCTTEPVVKAGGFSVQETSDSHIREIVVFAEKELTAEQGSFPHGSIVRVSKAESQVVAGIRYRLQVVLVADKVSHNLVLVVFKDLNGQLFLQEFQETSKTP